MQNKSNVESINFSKGVDSLSEILKKNEQSLSKEYVKNDEQVAKLQGELSAEKDGRKEERFIWIIVSAFFFDCFLLSNLDTYKGSLIILFMQMPMLMIFAKWLGVEYAIKILKPLSNKIDKLIMKSSAFE